MVKRSGYWPFDRVAWGHFLLAAYAFLALVGFTADARADDVAQISVTGDTDFGVLDANSDTSTRTFTISNSGTANLDLTGSPLVAIGGANAGDFTVTQQPSSVVAPAGTTTFEIRFGPKAPGPRTASLSIVNNDHTQNPYVLQVSGAGAQPGLSVTESVDRTTVTSPGTNLHFSLQVTNTGNVTLTAVSFSSRSVRRCPSGTLAPGASMTCTGTFLVPDNEFAVSSSFDDTAMASGVDPHGLTINASAASVTVTYVHSPAASLAKTVSPETLTAAGILTYTFTVTNTGNVNLRSVAINDPSVPVVSCPSGSVGIPPAPSQKVCVGTVTVDQARFDAGGTIVNKATATVTDIDNNVATSNEATATTTFSGSAALSLSKSASPQTLTAAGTVTYTIAAKNTGTLTLKSLAVSDPSLPGLSCPATTLAPGATVSCTGAITVDQTTFDHGGTIENTATARAVDPGGATVNADPAKATVTISGVSSLSLDNSASPTTLSAPGVVHYTLTAKNTGSRTLAGLSVANPGLPSPTCPVTTTLAPGATVVCTGSITVDQSRIDVGGQISIVGTANAIDSGGQSVMAQPQTAIVTIAHTPALSLVKSASPTTLSAPGPIGYTFAVENTGNVTLTTLVISDPKIAAVSCPATTLAPGGKITCSGSFTVDQTTFDAGGTITNAATAHAKAPGDVDVASNQSTASVTLNAVGAFTAAKRATETDYRAPGDVLHFEIVVTNTGNVTLTDIGIDDPLTPNEACPVSSLAPSASMTCTASYAVIQADIDRGSVHNTASIATGQIARQSTNEVVVAATQAPALTLLKSASPTSLSAPGSINYSFAVVNTGNVTLTSLAINDPKLASVTCPVTSLAPGAQTNCTGAFSVDQTGIDHGETIANTATAGAKAPDGSGINSGPSTANVTIQQTKTLTAVKATTSPSYKMPGDVLDYTITVTNTGNVTLTSMSIDDPLTANESCPVTTLAPGSSTVCTATYAVTQADLTHGSVSNTATVASSQTGAVTTNTVSSQFDPSEVRTRTSRVIANFMSARADQITASDPELVGRLSSCGGGGPLDIAGDNGDKQSGQFRFAAGLNRMKGAKGGSCPKLDVWASATWSSTTTDALDGRLGLLYFGIDYRLTPDLVFGILAQGDRMDESDKTFHTSVEGNGWMVGPYAVARLTDSLILDGRVAWGQSSNHVNPLGFYTDTFETDRWLARAQLTGQFAFGPWALQPHVGILYFEERQEQYTDSLGISINEQTVSLGRVTFGPKVRYTVKNSDGSVVTPEVGLTGIWDFDKAEIVDLNTGEPLSGSGNLRARIEGGVSVRLPGGSTFIKAEGFYDGIGDSSMAARGGTISFGTPLN